MGFLDEWKLKRKCIKDGRKNEYQDYLNAKESLAKDKAMYEGYVEKAVARFEEVKKTHGSEDTEYINAKNEVNKWKYTLEQTILMQGYVRPNNKEDILYRKKIIDEFTYSISQTLGDDTSIRFHGTSIYYTKEILKNGSISSSSSRYDGYDSSTDLEDEISVTTSKTIDRTLSYFTDFYAFQRSLPAGCLFVLKAEKPKDQELVKYESMKSFSFREYPERLLGICTTSENITRVKEWLKEYGYDENLVYTFDEFLSIAPSLKTAEQYPQTITEDSDSKVNELLDELNEEETQEIIEETQNNTEEKGITR